MAIHPIDELVLQIARRPVDPPEQGLMNLSAAIGSAALESGSVLGARPPENAHLLVDYFDDHQRAFRPPHAETGETSC